jgi:hypothetical protein
MSVFEESRKKVINRLNHIESLIKDHTRYLHDLQKKQALMGVETPSRFNLEAEDKEAEIAKLNSEREELKQKLKSSVVALDPNVIIIALNHGGSMGLILHLWESLPYKGDGSVKIARDEILRSEYNRHLDPRLLQDSSTLDIKFLKELLDHWEDWTEEIRLSELRANVLDFLRQEGCITDPEPKLIQLATDAKVILCTVDPDVDHPKLQPRIILCNPAKVESLHQRMDFCLLYSTQADKTIFGALTV